MWVVSGTTCTRFRCRFAGSLLTMTAGRFFLISPPTAGSKLTHHTSPRFTTDIADRPLRPLKGLGLALFVSRHLPVCSIQVVALHMGPDQALDEATNSPPTNHCVQPLVD